MKMKGKAPTLLWALLLLPSLVTSLVPSATGGEGKQRNDVSGLVASLLLSMLGARQPEPKQGGAEGIRRKLLEGRANGVGMG